MKYNRKLCLQSHTSEIDENNSVIQSGENFRVFCVEGFDYEGDAVLPGKIYLNASKVDYVDVMSESIDIIFEQCEILSGGHPIK